MNKTFRILFLVQVLAILGSSFHLSQQSKPDFTIYLIGDSTMADKPGTPEENPERGWGQLLPQFFNKKVDIINHAVNGRSTKSFLTEGRWDLVLNQLKPGDYVFIQFGHNDQKENDPTRYTNPWSAYRRNLEKFVAETHSKKANPVILTSIVRRNFNPEGTLIDTHGPYPFVANAVAKQLMAPFIDMQLLTEDFIIGLGPEKSKEVYLWVEPGKYEKFPDGRQDNTHLSLKGATEFARLVTEDIKHKNWKLARYLKP
jgi:lysophospholipase L1-like esterase